MLAGCWFNTAAKLLTTDTVPASSTLVRRKPGGAFDQRADRGTVAGTLNHVAFPEAGNDSVSYLWRANMYALHVLDHAAPIDTATAGLAHLIVMTQPSDHLPLRSTP